MVPGFFDNLREVSEVKLRILSSFLPPWGAKLGSLARQRNGVLWYVDGFAGKGKYNDGSDGSPLLGLHEASRIRAASRGYSLACFFVEANRNNWSTLDSLIEPYRSNGFHIRNERGEFSDLAGEINRTTSGSPILLFIDPFGIKPLVYSEFRQLLSRRSPVDLILTFQHTAIPRLAKDHPHLVSQAIGTDAWLAGWDQLQGYARQTEHVLRFFGNNLRRDGDFFDVVNYPIRASLDSAPKYFLVFASRHYDAFELWNDQVAQQQSRLSQRQYHNLIGQSSFLLQFDEEISGIDLLNSIRAFVSTAERFNRRDIVMHFVTKFWGQYHTREIKKAVASMLTAGELKRELAAGRKIDNDYMYVA